MITTTRPEAGEYSSSFADYVGRIADDEDIVAVLVAQLDQFLAHLGRIPELRGDYRYAPGKWSIKESKHPAVAQHDSSSRAKRGT